MAEQPKNLFLAKTGEKENFNQYWYSAYTIQALVKEIEANTSRAAFLSTPSVYYSLTKGSECRTNSYVFDFDDQWAKDPHFVKYDFNKPEDLPAELLHTFDCVVIDPPFITEEVWEKYATAAKALLKEGGKVVCSTVAENEAIMQRLLGAKPVAFKPSIPHLVYQYNFFLNFEPSAGLHEKNPEIPEDD